MATLNLVIVNRYLSRFGALQGEAVKLPRALLLAPV